jgi:hypothetical protein
MFSDQAIQNFITNGVKHRIEVSLLKLNLALEDARKLGIELTLYSYYDSGKQFGKVEYKNPLPPQAPSERWVGDRQDT